MLAPEAFLLIGCHWDPQSLLGAEHLVGSAAQHQMNVAAASQQQLQSPLRQRLRGCAGHRKDVGMHGQALLRVTGIGVMPVSSASGAGKGSAITSRSI